MTKDEAISYIESLSSGITRRPAGSLSDKQASGPVDNPGRTSFLLSSLGHPEKDLRFIHVCGSNGKGSVCAMLESILRTAGYRTGLYISPHLQDFCERIRVNGSMITGSELAAFTEKLKPAADSMEEAPGLFFFLTALAIDYFHEQECDIVILESGIGGRYDSTNVLPSVELAVLTNIGLEHTQILGDTIEEITRDKAGIIKPGCDCVVYRNDPSSYTIIRERCQKLNVPLLTAGPDDLAENYELSLKGSYQSRNAGLVLKCIEALRNRRFAISEEDLRYGLSQSRWPGRFEILSRDPLLILDGGHNPQCARTVIDSFRSLCPKHSCHIMVGMMKDKDYRKTLRILTEIAEDFICVSVDDPRTLNPSETAEFLRKTGVRAQSFDNLSQAYDQLSSYDDGRPSLIFGSLYLAGEIRNLLKLLP